LSIIIFTEEVIHLICWLLNNCNVGSELLWSGIFIESSESFLDGSGVSESSNEGWESDNSFEPFGDIWVGLSPCSIENGLERQNESSSSKNISNSEVISDKEVLVFEVST